MSYENLLCSKNKIEEVRGWTYHIGKCVFLLLSIKKEMLVFSSSITKVVDTQKMAANDKRVSHSPRVQWRMNI